jgi:hypothetical protein
VHGALAKPEVSAEVGCHGVIRGVIRLSGRAIAQFVHLLLFTLFGKACRGGVEDPIEFQFLADVAANDRQPKFGVKSDGATSVCLSPALSDFCSSSKLAAVAVSL